MTILHFTAPRGFFIVLRVYLDFGVSCYSFDVDPPQTSSLLEGLLAMGLPGFVIAGMGYWIVRLQKKLDEVQEKRVENALQFTTAANELGAAVERNTEVLRQQSPRRP